jgi:acetyl-CoA acyltransferase
MKHAYVCDAIRTPIGRHGGALASIRPDDLAAIAIKALVTRNSSIDWGAVDDVILGCANQAGEDNRNVARMALLLANLPKEVPGSTVNRLCGSGLDALGTAARAIRSGDTNLMIAGGVESMSRAPYVMNKADRIFARDQKLEDTTIGWRLVNPLMRKMYGVATMPETAENVAKHWSISREDQDHFAFSSQEKAAAAQGRGRFTSEIIPVHVANTPTTFSNDEHPRATSLDRLAQLRPIVAPDGTVTAGNSSGVNDGAAALIVASENAASRFNLNPRARIVGMAAAGVEPGLMGIGPVEAARSLLERCNLRLDDIDVIELNEAFAAQVIAVLKELNIDPGDPRINPNGGAIALGHPLGMSGARLALTAVEELHLQSKRRALILMCVGVGQGVALLLERV